MAASLWERVRRLEECSALLGEMALRLRHLAPTMEGMIVFFAQRERYEKLLFPQKCQKEMAEGSAFPVAWQTALQGCEALLGREETALVAALGDVLGQTDLDSQLQALEGTRELLDQRIEGARQISQRRSSLYRTMGVLGGAALFILMI